MHRHGLRLLSICILAIFILGLSLRFGIALAISYYNTDPFAASEIYRISEQLASTGDFANPYICRTGATAHAAPGYPFIQAGLFRLFPAGRGREIARILLSCAVSALVYALLPWLAVALRLSIWVGTAAGLFGAAVPFFFWVEVRGLWDAPWTALFLVIVMAISASVFRGPAWARFALCGLAWGVAFLFSPTLLPLFPAFLLGFVIFSRPRAVALPRAAFIGALAILVVTPWTIRNYRQFGHLFWIRDTLWLELHIANNPGALPIEVDNRLKTSSYAVHPCNRPAECAEVQRVGEYAYMEGQKAQFVDFVRRDPREFMSLTLAHTWYFWALPFNSTAKVAFSIAIALLCFCGVALMLLRREFAGIWCAAALIVYSVPYSLIQSDVRYAYPVRPVMLLPAAYVALAAGSRRMARA